MICFSLTFSATNVRGGVNRASMKYDRNGWLFPTWNRCYLESVDSARARRRQTNEMSKITIEPESLKDAGYHFNESKHI